MTRQGVWLAALMAMVTAPAPALADRVRMWLTTADGTQRLAEQAPQPIVRSRLPAAIVVNPSRRYQTMVGFGAAVTDASAELIARLPASERTRLIRELFGPDLALGFVRITIGASDFSRRSYSFDDPPDGQSDPTLRHFSTAAAEPFLLPVLLEARAVNPDLRIMASPWSAPAWMKSSGSMIGGSLRLDAYPAYAAYLVRAVRSFAAKGVPIDYLSIQNEPAYEPPDYPGMIWPAAGRAHFLARYLGPLLERARTAPRVLEWDHNWDRPGEPLKVLANAAARRHVTGIAWHCYGGDPAAQSFLHDANPDLDVFETECSGGGWHRSWAESLRMMMGKVIIGSARHWARGILLWNLALDETMGPHLGGCRNCRGVVTIDSRTGAVTRNVEYYVLGHASRFVRAGARRIASTSNTGEVATAAFRNPDGSLILLTFNGGAAQTIAIRAPTGRFTATLPAGAAASFTWR